MFAIIPGDKVSKPPWKDAAPVPWFEIKLITVSEIH